MRRMLRVLIADNCFASQSEASRLLKEYDIQADFCPKDGNAVISGICTFSPDIVVMNLAMSGTDAFGVLAECNAAQTCAPRFIVTCSVENDTVAAKAAAAGAIYCIQRPYELWYLASRLEAIRLSGLIGHAPTLPDAALQCEAAVSDALRLLSVPSNIKGCQYLRTAVLLTLRQPELVGRITKELYPLIAGRFDTNVACVERSMRIAIEIAWSRGDIGVLNDYFGNTVSADKGKPTNSEFIALVSDRIRLSAK